MPEQEDAEPAGPVHAATRARIVWGVTVGTIAVTSALFGTACPAYGCPASGCGSFPDAGNDSGAAAIDGGDDTGP